jgi:hypothetical protein
VKQFIPIVQYVVIFALGTHPPMSETQMCRLLGIRETERGRLFYQTETVERTSVGKILRVKDAAPPSDVRERAQAAGRNPDDIKVMFLVTPVLGDSAEDAEAKRQKMVNTDAFITRE